MELLPHLISIMLFFDSFIIPIWPPSLRKWEPINLRGMSPQARRGLISQLSFYFVLQFSKEHNICWLMQLQGHHIQESPNRLTLKH